MLVMSKGALSAAQAETYYEEKWSHDDYYAEKERVVGQWFGRGADELGLDGSVKLCDLGLPGLDGIDAPEEPAGDHREVAAEPRAHREQGLTGCRGGL